MFPWSGASRARLYNTSLVGQRAEELIEVEALLSYGRVDNCIPLVGELLGVEVVLTVGQGDGVEAPRNGGRHADQLLNVEVGGVVGQTYPNPNAVSLDARLDPPLEGEEGDSAVVLLVIGDFLRGPSSEFGSGAPFPSLAGGRCIHQSRSVDELVDVSEKVGARSRHGRE